jgi:hypothetical protein
MRVYVVTDVESGWDCVRGVYKTRRDALESIVYDDLDTSKMSDKELINLIEDKHRTKIIHETTLQ